MSKKYVVHTSREEYPVWIDADKFYVQDGYLNFYNELTLVASFRDWSYVTRSDALGKVSNN